MYKYDQYVRYIRCAYGWAVDEYGAAALDEALGDDLRRDLDLLAETSPDAAAQIAAYSLCYDIRACDGMTVLEAYASSNADACGPEERALSSTQRAAQARILGAAGEVLELEPAIGFGKVYAYAGADMASHLAAKAGTDATVLLRLAEDAAGHTFVPPCTPMPDNDGGIIVRPPEELYAAALHTAVHGMFRVKWDGEDR